MACEVDRQEQEHATQLAMRKSEAFEGGYEWIETRKKGFLPNAI